jgi:hypothetical protein
MDYFYRLMPDRIRLGSVALSAVALLVAACGGGGGGNDGSTSPPPPPPPPAPSGSVTISGTVAYEFVPPNANCQGLNFAATVVRPIRGATVQLVDVSNRELARTVSGDDGSYAFANIETNLDVRIRVRAELKQSGSPSWDVEIRDNVVDPSDPNPPVLADRPLYAIVSDFNTGTSDISRNLTARTGWDIAANAYTGTRAAAPFAILDAIYSGMRLVLSVDPGAPFPPLDAFWSVNNISSAGTIDIDSGELPSSFYRRDIDSLFLLGDAGSDTEEFDDHVVVHEWGHYFEDNFSRTDSVGGRHGIGDRLDPRLAFGEGWASALAGMALNDPLYCDTGQPGTTIALLPLGLEDGGYDAQGWYDEVSVLRFLFDLWDTTDDEGPGEGTDGGSIGFGPIYDTMTGPQASTEAFTTIFSFVAELRTMLPQGDQDFVDAQLLREDMTPGFDIWGAGELNDANDTVSVLPVYTDVPVNGVPVDICLTSDFDPFQDNNKLGELRFLRIDIPSTGSYRVVVTTDTSDPDYPPDDPLDGQDQSDPDLYFFRDGVPLFESTKPDANEEQFVTPILTGPDTYVAELLEFRYFDPETPDFDPDLGTPDVTEPVCYEISITAQ